MEGISYRYEFISDHDSDKNIFRKKYMERGDKRTGGRVAGKRYDCYNRALPMAAGIYRGIVQQLQNCRYTENVITI